MHPNVKQPPRLKYHYLSQLDFEEKKIVLERGLAELSKGNIPEEVLERGERYRELIESSFTPYVSVQKINKKVGYGVFAEEGIKAHEYIGEYTGIVRENIKVYFAPINNYCYEYPVPDQIGRSYVIDATKGNFTRFINHSYRPNLKPVYAFFDGFYHLIFISLREIEKGEQLYYEYGPSYWYIRSPPQDI